MKCYFLLLIILINHTYYITANKFNNILHKKVYDNYNNYNNNKNKTKIDSKNIDKEFTEIDLNSFEETFNNDLRHDNLIGKRLPNSEEKNKKDEFETQQKIEDMQKIITSLVFT